jgi:hypothetical protein
VQNTRIPKKYFDPDHERVMELSDEGNAGKSLVGMDHLPCL